VARSHPPTLLKLVERTLREECGVLRGDCVLVAVSGGRDSTSLLHALGWLGPKLGLGLWAHGVDHGLRAEAGAELDVAEGLAKRCGVPFSRTVLDAIAGSNLQARARAARYRALDAAARRAGARFIATAHHADDRAETVMMRLLRGAPAPGLAVLAPRAGSLIRPMIRVTRAGVEAHVRRHGVEFCDDPSNADRRFLRVRVRQELMPVLVALAPNVVGSLCQLADELGGSLPSVVDGRGEPLRLNRGQRSQLSRAIALAQAGARISLSDWQELRLDPTTRAPMVVATPHAVRPRAAAQPPKSPGARGSGR
jgi:tRNA(Ile)-lysidine synthase